MKKKKQTRKHYFEIKLVWFSKKRLKTQVDWKKKGFEKVFLLSNNSWKLGNFIFERQRVYEEFA